MSNEKPVDRFSIKTASTRLFHWGPLLALSIISYISTVGFFALLLWWPPLDFWGQLHFGLYMTQVPLILGNFFKALSTGPGFVPLGWRPDRVEDRAYLQYCRSCQGYKAPRSHHCRKCNRCVLKMDHHCPWINTCCGHRNHVSFILFLLFAPVGCLHASLVLICCGYRAFFRDDYHKEIFAQYTPPLTYSVPLMVCMVLATGLAIAVFITVGFLFVVQMSSVIKNKTGIEMYICEKAEEIDRDDDDLFEYPYDLGVKDNLKSFWFFGDGIVWPVVEGKSQYELTMEQLRQKEAKRQRSVEFEAVSEYNGRCCTVSYGTKTFCNVPLTDEPRMKLRKGDAIRVTRGKRYWLYGEKLTDYREKGPSVRGWFPKECVQRNSSFIDYFTEKKEL